MELVNDESRRRQLAEFLRSRRDRLKPGDLGLPSGRRRRAPGLRREEVAELAGIGTAWYTWLEQARDIRPSEGALRRIARALQLEGAERRYFLDLALERAPRPLGEECVPPSLHAVLESFRGPAFIKGLRWDLLAWNSVADQVLDLGRVPNRNLLRNMFTRASRALLPNWEHYGRQHVAMFRADVAGHLKDPWVIQLVEEMSACSLEFKEWWDEHAVAEMKSGHKTYQHPHAGVLSFDFTTLVPAENCGMTMVVYFASDEQTEAAVQRLIAARQAGDPRVRESIWSMAGSAGT